MAKIMAFAGSNSSTSINFKLVSYVAKLTGEADLQLLNMADFPLPMFSEDLEKKEGYLKALVEFKNDIQQAKALIISVNEHNGAVSAYFKNLIDWLSRIDRNFLEETKLLLLSTSPGKRGASSALEYTKGSLPRFGAKLEDAFSLPSFYDNFSVETQEIKHPKLDAQLRDIVANFVQQI